ncbi:hypothetical protein GWN42_02200 [candidate division KSB1 bacterium]|nr:hypothetical protein [candidate division KSB1 bacterium]
MLDNLTVRINEVNSDEIERLNTTVSALSSSRFQNFKIQISNEQQYVLSLKPNRLTDISDILDSLRRVVKPDRIVLNCGG